MEAGLEYGNPIWMYVIMLIVAGFTALYTTRCVMMVFYGKTKVKDHIHPVGKNMKIALFPLAFGAITTWLLIFQFSSLMSSTLQMHLVEVIDLKMLFNHVILTPSTWIALALIALGIMIWFGKDKLSGILKLFNPVAKISEASFGFEKINKIIVNITNEIGEKLRGTQTGNLNWNIFYILITLVLVFAFLLVGA